MSTPQRRRGGRSLVGKLLLAGWIVVTLIGMASLSLSHIVPMPEPDDDARLTRAMLALRRGSAEHFLVHVIYVGCSCTERLFAHLVERGTLTGGEEIIVLVGGDDPVKRRSAERAGFGLTTVSAAELATRFGIEAAPVLVAFDGARRLRYVGGYYGHPAAVSPLDERIYAQLTSGVTPESLPVFGCAVSPRLQKSVDPLGIVYSRR